MIEALIGIGEAIVLALALIAFAGILGKVAGHFSRYKDIK